MSWRTFCCLVFGCIASISIASLTQIAPPPAPQRLVVHSNVLNEDRVIWVRIPAAAQGKKNSYAVLYITDAGTNVNEIGSTIDFLADNNLMPPLIVVGIANTDRNRDLTPSHAGVPHWESWSPRLRTGTRPNPIASLRDTRWAACLRFMR